jgi:hypothetical protein
MRGGFGMGDGLVEINVRGLLRANQGLDGVVWMVGDVVVEWTVGVWIAV